MLNVGFLFAFLILCHSILLAWSFVHFNTTTGSIHQRQEQQLHFHWQLWWIRGLLLGTIFDNYVLFLSTMFELDDVKVLYPARYWIHALVLPWLAPYTFSCVQRAAAAAAAAQHDTNGANKTDLNAASNDANKSNITAVSSYYGGGMLKRILECSVLVAAIGWGFYFECWNLQLELTTLADPHNVLTDFGRWTRKTTASDYPPLATIGVIAIAIAGGWRLYFNHRGCIWLWAASTFIFVVNTIASLNVHPFYPLLAGNVAEVFFAAGVLATETHVVQSYIPVELPVGKKRQ